MDRYIVMTAAACMPSSCKYGPYRKVAVVERNLDLPLPVQIHPRHKTIKRIVRKWDRLHHGKTERCAYWQAYNEAEELCKRLNKDDKNRN